MIAERQVEVKPSAPVRIATAARFGVLQRKCACGGSSGFEGECAACSRSGVSLQRQANRGAAPAAAPPIVHEVLRSPGQPLDRTTRAFMEPRFGHDFSGVRVHADARAAESARAVRAKAYTVGNEIVFNSGEYQPHTANGLGSLAHELAHVVQQSPSWAGAIPEPIPMGVPGDDAEREAEQAGRGGWSRAAAPVQEQPCLRRQPQGDDQPKKEPPPVISLPHPLDRLDIKPIIPGPIGAPSLEDINKGLFFLRGQGQGGPGNVGCAPGWEMRNSGPAQGLCCPKYVADPDRCCPPYRLTNLGRCCPSDQYADGPSCVKFTLPTPTITGPLGPGVPGTGTTPEPPLTRGDLPSRGPNLPPLPPLTVSMDMYFKLNRPGSVVSDDKTLRDSLTVSGGVALDGLIAWLKNGPQFSVQLTGKASIEGPTAHNRELGEYRARSVANALARAGVAGRIADPPGLAAACPSLEDGIHNCGDTTASKTIDERDRQVRATLFIPPGRP